MSIWRSRRFIVGLAVGAVLIVLLANAHLVYVATRSQPDCVEHIKERANEASPIAFRAARSSC